MVKAAQEDRVVPHLCFEACAGEERHERFCTMVKGEQYVYDPVTTTTKTIATAETLPVSPTPNIPPCMECITPPGTGAEIAVCSILGVAFAGL